MQGYQTAHSYCTSINDFNCIVPSGFNHSTPNPVCLLRYLWWGFVDCLGVEVKHSRLLWKMKPCRRSGWKYIVFFLHSTEITKSAYSPLFNHKAEPNCFSVCVTYETSGWGKMNVWRVFLHLTQMLQWASMTPGNKEIRTYFLWHQAGSSGTSSTTSYLEWRKTF